MYLIIYFVSTRGENYTLDFIKSLPENVQRKVMAYLDLLEDKGVLLHRPFADLLRDGIYELRPDFGHLAPRILYFYLGKKIILTHGFLKKTDKVPEKEIDRAIKIRNEYCLKM